MPMPESYIHSLGHFHPETVLDNDFFRDLNIGSDAEWVEDRTGIKARRSVLDKTSVVAMQRGVTSLQQLRQDGKVMSIASMVEPAWALLRARATDLDLKAIDAVICGTSVPDFDIPANAAVIAERLGINCLSFDANSACSSFVLDLHVARNFIRSGTHKTLAIFNPERYSLRMDYNDRNSCVLFGDGCTAALLSSQPKSGSLRLVDCLMASDPSGFEHVKIPVGQTFSQNGKAVQKFAISRTLEVTQQILERNGLTPADLSYFIGHQANLRMVMSVAERLGLPPEKHLYNVENLGNQGAAGAPAVLSMNWDLFKFGELIAVSVVGSGLTWGSVLLQKV